MNSALYFVLPAGLALVTAGLALYRKLLANQEEDSLHLAPGGEQIVSKQAGLASKLSGIDRWGKVLTALVVVTACISTILFLYQEWLVSAAR